MKEILPGHDLIDCDCHTLASSVEFSARFIFNVGPNEALALSGCVRACLESLHHSRLPLSASCCRWQICISGFLTKKTSHSGSITCYLSFTIRFYHLLSVFHFFMPKEGGPATAGLRPYTPLAPMPRFSNITNHLLLQKKIF